MREERLGLEGSEEVQLESSLRSTVADEIVEYRCERSTVTISWRALCLSTPKGKNSTEIS